MIWFYITMNNMQSMHFSEHKGEVRLNLLKNSFLKFFGAPFHCELNAVTVSDKVKVMARVECRPDPTNREQLDDEHFLQDGFECLLILFSLIFIKKVKSLATFRIAALDCLD